MIGQLILILILTGGFLFTPIVPVRFILMLIILMRIWALAAQSLIPRFIRIERDRKTLYALCHREFDLEIRIINKSPFPLSYFILSDELYGLYPMEKRERALSLRPFEERVISYKAVGDSRGVKRSGPVKLKGTGPFRLFSWEKKIDACQQVIIYPQVYRVRLDQKRGMSGGSIKISNKLYEDVTSFQSLREYIPGDELKRINWKISARLGKLYTMEYDSTIYFPVHIILNLSAGEYPLSHRGELLERAVETAASLAVCFIRMGQKVSLIASGYIPEMDESPDSRQNLSRDPLYLPENSGVEQSARILKTLAAVKAHPEGLNLIDLISRKENPVRRGTKYFIIGPPPLTEDGNFLFEQKRKGRDLEYFIIAARGTEKKKLLIPGLPVHRVEEYGEGLIRES